MVIPEQNPIIIVEGLTARFGDDTVLEEVNLEVFPGEILVIIGESGSGKTVLMKHMIGLFKPCEGRVLVKGIDLARASDEERHRLRLEIGVLFQSGALFGSMTLSENIELPISEYTQLSPEMIDQVVRMKLGMVNLSGYEHHMPAELSGGMKKRAALARAMALDPSILFFDEPSSGLDPVTAAGLDFLIKEINRTLGTTMVIVTHELASIMNIAQRVIMLDKNARGIIAEGNPHELKERSRDPRVIAFFNRQPPKTREGEIHHV